MRNLAIACLVLAVVACVAPRSRGGDLGDAVARLLNSSSDAAAARAGYEACQQIAPHDPRVDYAYALALLKQHHYADALPYLERYTATHDDDLAAARVWLWTLVQGRRYSEALSGAVRVARRLPTGPDQNAAPCAATAQFLGTLIGYLEQARSGALDAQQKLQCTNDVLAGLGSSYLAEFDQGRRHVQTRYAALDEARNVVHASRAAAAADRKDQYAAAVLQQRFQVLTAETSIQSQTETLRDNTRQFELVRQQVYSLSQQRLLLERQYFAAQARLEQLRQPQTQTAEREVVVGPNPTEETVTVSRQPVINLDRQAEARILAANLTAIQKQAFDVDRRLAALLAQAAALGGERVGAVEALAANRTAIDNSQRRRASFKKQLLRLERSQPTRRGPSAEMLRLATYLPFPFGQERQRVVDWFAP